MTLPKTHLVETVIQLHHQDDIHTARRVTLVGDSLTPAQRRVQRRQARDTLPGHGDFNAVPAAVLCVGGRNLAKTGRATAAGLAAGQLLETKAVIRPRVHRGKTRQEEAALRRQEKIGALFPVPGRQVEFERHRCIDSRCCDSRHIATAGGAHPPRLHKAVQIFHQQSVGRHPVVTGLVIVHAQQAAGAPEIPATQLDGADIVNGVAVDEETLPAVQLDPTAALSVDVSIAENDRQFQAVVVQEDPAVTLEVNGIAAMDEDPQRFPPFTPVGGHHSKAMVAKVAS